MSIKVISVDHPILNGPSSGFLWDAAKYSFDKNVPDLAFFEIKNTFPQVYPEETLKIKVRILGMEHEDGSGKSFNIHGYITNSCIVRNYAGHRFHAYYNAGSPRHGTITIEMN